MQVGSSPLAYTPFGGEGGPPIAPAAAIALAGLIGLVDIDSIPTAGVALSGGIPLPPGGVFIPSADIAVGGLIPNYDTTSLVGTPNATIVLTTYNGFYLDSPPQAQITLSANLPGIVAVIAVPAIGFALSGVAPEGIDSVQNAQITFSAPLANLLDPRVFPPFLIWPGYSSDGTSLTIPIAELPGLSVVEADAVTGDWREILQTIFRSSWQHESQITDWFSKPDTYMIFTKDFYNSTIDSYFQIKFITDMGEPNVAPEP